MDKSHESDGITWIVVANLESEFSGLV
jgi:hypothetical protein